MIPRVGLRLVLLSCDWCTAMWFLAFVTMDQVVMLRGLGLVLAWLCVSCPSRAQPSTGSSCWKGASCKGQTCWTCSVEEVQGVWEEFLAVGESALGGVGMATWPGQKEVCGPCLVPGQLPSGSYARGKGWSREGKEKKLGLSWPERLVLRPRAWQFSLTAG